MAWHPLGELSHGFRQRVGIAQALIHDPKIIILDEPINGLDPIQIVEMRDLILSLRGKHTVVLSSHILSEITKTCDRILIIDQGRLVAEGQEAALQRSQSRKMIMTVQIRGQVPHSELGRFPGLKVVSEKNHAGDVVELKVESEGDLRGELSAVLVRSGALLLEMRRDADDLEALFMSLVRDSKSN